MTLIFDAIGAFLVGLAAPAKVKAQKPDPAASDDFGFEPVKITDEAAYWRDQHKHMAAELDAERARAKDLSAALHTARAQLLTARATSISEYQERLCNCVPARHDILRPLR